MNNDLEMNASIYVIGVVHDSNIEPWHQPIFLWLCTLNDIFSKEILSSMGESICQTMGWDDLVDGFAFQLYIARPQHEVVLKIKYRLEEVGEVSSKRPTHGDKVYFHTNPIHGEVIGKTILSVNKKRDHCKEKKSPIYKLESAIEVAKDLRKGNRRKNFEQ